MKTIKHIIMTILTSMMGVAWYSFKMAYVMATAGAIISLNIGFACALLIGVRFYFWIQAREEY